jgi:hypothetical protein
MQEKMALVTGASQTGCLYLLRKITHCGFNRERGGFQVCCERGTETLITSLYPECIYWAIMDFQFTTKYSVKCLG